MLHTYVGADVESVKDLVRGPMIDYLGSSVSLIREAAWTFPTITQRSEETGQSPGEVFDQQDLSQDELDALRVVVGRESDLDLRTMPRAITSDPEMPKKAESGRTD